VVEPCDFSDDVERRDGAVLERHTLEAGHGDVCRNAPDPEQRDSGDGASQPAATTFFCPLHCLHLQTAPYCGAAANTVGSSGRSGRSGGGISPCRVALVVVSEVDRLSDRLADLEATRQRAIGDGDRALVQRVEGQISLVKFERRRAKISAGAGNRQRHLRRR
jgi:hypothetical protein